MNPSPAIPSDRALLDAWIAGQDEAALGELMQRHRPMLVALARRVLRDPAGAEDVAQEVFTRLSEDAGGITGPVDAWLRTATGNLAISHLRSRLRRRRREAEAVVPDHDQGDHLEDAELRLQVNESVAALTPAEQDLIIRVFWLGHTMEAIAREQRVSRVAISKRVHRSMERMRSRLHRRGVRLGLAAFALLLAGGGRLSAEVAALARPALAGWAVVAGLLIALGLATALLAARAPAVPATAGPGSASASASAQAVGAAEPLPYPAQVRAASAASSTTADTAPSAGPAGHRPVWQEVAPEGWQDLDFRDWIFDGIRVTKPLGNPLTAEDGEVTQLSLGPPLLAVIPGPAGDLLRVQADPHLLILCAPPASIPLEHGVQLSFELREDLAQRRGPDHGWITNLTTHIFLATPDGTIHVSLKMLDDGRSRHQEHHIRRLDRSVNAVSYFRERMPIAVGEPTEIRHPRRRLLSAAERQELVRHIATLTTDPAPPATAVP